MTSVVIKQNDSGHSASLVLAGQAVSLVGIEARMTMIASTNAIGQLVTPASGWKISRIVVQKSSSMRPVVLKNGSNLSTKKEEYFVITIVMQNAKNGGVNEVVYDVFNTSY